MAIMSIITNATVNWWLNIGNDPQFEVHVDKAPSEDSFIYDEKILECGTTLYLATNGIWANYYLHDPDNESGFCGARFHLKMSDGTVRTIKGPWSSRCSVMNEHFGVNLMEVTIIEEGGSRLCGNMDINAIKSLNAIYEAGAVFGHGKYGYRIVNKEQHIAQLCNSNEIPCVRRMRSDDNTCDHYQS